MNKTKKLLIISLSLSLGTVGVILYFTFSKDFLSQLAEIKTHYFLIAIMAHVLGWVVWGYRINVLSRLTTIKMDYLRSLEIVLISMFAAALTPSYAGGEPVRIYFLGKEEGGTTGSASAVIFGERALDFIFLIIAMSFSLFLIGDIFLKTESVFSLEVIILFLTLIIVLVTFLILISLFKPEKIKKFIGIFEKPIKKIKPGLTDTIYEEIEVFNESLWMFLENGKKYLILGLGTTILFWVFEFSIPYLLLTGLGYEVPYILAFAGYALVMISIMIPISPGGTGVAEAVFYFVYNSIVEGLPGVGVLVLLWRFITYYLNLAVGAFVSTKVLHSLATIENEM